jgi:membrane-bound metal-dependent hydrolase YbcI (DUF457 family)
MRLVNTPSEAPRTALSYITIGAILTIWAAVWMWQFPATNSRFLRVLCYGILLTGLALLVIGFSVGYIGRAARHSELPPVDTREPTAAGPAVASNPAPQPAVKPVVGGIGTPPPSPTATHSATTNGGA